MSEEGEKPADAPAPKKGKMGLIIGIVVAAVTLVGGSVAGAVLGPKLLGSSEESEPSGKHEKSEKSEKSHKAEKKSEHGEKSEGDDAEGAGKIATYDIPSVVVDLRDGDGRIRHLKVGLTAEIGEHTPMEEFKLLVPRAREAAITFLRSLSFEEVSDPQHFVAIKDELAKRVTESLGEERVHRMVLTDFVVQ
jgi:flagellar basal body-associated protein FliL